MFAEFTEWWLNQMRGLLPAGLVPAGALPDARIIAIKELASPAASGPAAGTILLRRGGQESVIAALDLDHPRQVAPIRLATGLRLPAGQIMCREVTLPLAAARNVEAVIGFEMDRLTPFTADELFWGIGGLRQDRAHGRISVNLFFVLRAQLETLLLSLRRAGLHPAFIETGTSRIDLASEHRPAGQLRQRSLAALCGVLALACLATPFLRQQLALDSAANAIAAVSPAAAVAERLRRQLDIASSGQAAIAEAQRQGDALQVLSLLTDALPDGTWLDDLTLNSGDLTFDGRSSNAAALIGRLSAMPGLKDPSFTAPVTRTADGSADQFSLHATVQE